MNKIYAGIGSRTTPKVILDLMTSFAKIYAGKGYTLYSGGADGADTAFEYGVDQWVENVLDNHIKVSPCVIHYMIQTCN